jgi:cytochrome c oxidase assembly protein subunit 15
MTGSGMGCPDWPKCFGYYIPPTDVEQLTWKPNRSFEEGQVIIKDQALWVATGNFTTRATYDKSQWRPYTKHDYAIFNPTHTWIEYLNRLAGALAGFAVFGMAVSSFAFWKDRKSIVLLSWLTVFLMGLQGWLGATVVYSVLNPLKITVHMIVALLVVGVVLSIIRKAESAKFAGKANVLFGNVLGFALVLTLIQVTMGTQVRQFVDEQVKIYGYDGMRQVLNNPATTFYFHRSFSIVVLLANLFLFQYNKKKTLGFAKINWVLSLIIVEIITGIAMAYFAFPFGSQAIHLVVASLLFGIQFYMLLEYRSAKKQLYFEDSKNL